jgi:hypothetical protein
MAGMHLIVRPNLNGCQSLAHDRLLANDRPFPQYSADAVIPGSDVIMVTTPSTEIVPNYGMGLQRNCWADRRSLQPR